MSAAADPSGGFRRLNPLVFPSETTLRFALLIVFALCGSASLYATFWGAFNQHVERAADMCVAGFVPLVAKPTGNFAAVVPADLLPKIAECSALLRPKVAWQFIGVVITLAVSGVLYRWLPPFMLLRNRLRPVSASDAPGLLEEVQDLCRSVGLPRIPALVWNPLATSTPHVFGGNGRYYCAFSGAFVVRLYTDRPVFRTIVLHELAHIQCGDVGKTYFAISTGIAFVATAIVQCMVVVLFAGPGWLDVFEMLLKTILWTAVIALSGASILRAREYYADVQTSVWEGMPSTLVRTLSTFSSSSVARWQSYLRLHPALSARRAAVVDPSVLFRLSAGDAFAVGFAAWLTIDVLKGGAAAFVPHDLQSMMIFQVLAMIVLPAVILVLAVGAVGVGVWRGTFADLVRFGHATPGTGRLGLAMGASSLVPAGLNLLRAGIGESDLPFAAMLRLLSLDAYIGVAVTLGCFLVFSWVVDAASAWFGVVLRSRSPRWVLFFTILTVLLLVVGTLAWASFAVYFYWIAGSQPGADRFTAALLAAQVVGVPAFIVSAIVWAFPLAAGLWHRHAARQRPADWVFLDGSAPTIAVAAAWRPAGALTTGLAAGLASCLLMEMVYFANTLPAWMAEAILAGFSWIRSGMQWSVGNEGAVIPATVALFQLTAAVIAAAAARGFPTLSALLAAFVAGCVAAVFNLLFFAIDTKSSLGEALLAPMMLLAVGSLVALPFSIAVGWIRAALVGRSGTAAFSLAPSPAASRTSALSWLARGVAASLCVAVMFGLAMKYRRAFVAEQERRALITAAESGDASAQTRLAMSYLAAGSAPQDKAQGALWMLKAAQNGDAEGMYWLAVMCFKGLAMPQSDSLAAHWLLMSAEKGNRNAVRDLGAVYLEGRVPEDAGLALDLLRRAAEKGNADAQNSLGLAYRLGRGIAQDDGKALEWFRRAADQNHAAGLTNLGWMHHLGLGGAKDETAAVALFTKAAVLGYAEAQFNLGQIQAEGRIVPRDETQATMWLRKAANQGYAPAAQRLRDLCEHGVRPACG